jgi:hypothetical protein
MSKKNQHVVPHPDVWAVKGERNHIAYVCPPHTAGSGAGGAPNRNQFPPQMFIHGRNGQIHERNTYGDDPYPPKG